MKILAVDTALGACSVAVLDGERIAAHRFEAMARGHAEALAPMVEQTMRDAALGFPELDHLAVTTGPGTFTGQRVGLAFMRALRVALKIPLIGVTTLEAMGAAAMAETETARAAVAHDARRDELYLQLLPGGAPQVLKFADALSSVRELSRGSRFALAGTAAPRLALELEGFALSDVRQPDALWVARLARARPAPDTAPAPLYLRAPDAKLPPPRLFDPARESVALLAALHEAAFDEAWSAEAIAALLASPGAFAFFTRDGFVLARAAAGEAEILTLAVAPQARRRGLGRALMKAAADAARARGADTLFLEVGVANQAALKLYERAGFAAVGRRKAYYGAGDALVLRAPLSPPLKFA